MTRGRVFHASGVAVLAAGLPWLASAATPDISKFALYAERSVSLGSGDLDIGGDIGVRLVATPVFGTQLSIAPNTIVDLQHTAFSPSVVLGRGSSTGEVQANSIQNNGGRLAGQSTFPAASMPPLPLAQAGAKPGSAVTVAPFGLVMLMPGNYGALVDNGTLQLSPGSYSFSSVTLSNAAQIWAPQGGVHISVAGALTTGGRVTISPGLFAKADQLTISVAGSDSPTGSPAVFMGQFSFVHALLAAPNGTLVFDEGVQASGAFAAFDIKAEPGVVVNFDTGFSASTAGQHGCQQLSGYFTVPSGPGDTPLVGPVPADTLVHLAVGLPARNAGNLPTLAAQVSDPTSPMYRQYLTVDQFVQMFGAAPTDYQALISWAQSVGLKVENTHRNNLLLSVGGTAAQVEQVLYTNLVYRLRSDGSNFVTVDRDPSLDLCAVPILRISGLNDVIAPEPMIRFSGLVQSNQGSAGPDAGSGPGGLFAPPDFRTAYAPGVSQTGTGQTVALFQKDGFYTGDITSYQKAFGLNVPVNRHLLNNFDGIPCSGPGIFLGQPCPGEAEAALDIEMAMSMAPGLDSVEVYEGTLANSILAEIAAPPLGVPLSYQASSSWVYGIDDNTRNILHEFAIQGQSFFQASGDSGAYLSDPSDCRDQPWTTVVGGTVLSMNGFGASWKSETTWPGSGGGILTNLSIPDYQKNLNFSQNTQLSMTNRNAPDVSLVASGVLRYSGNGSQLNTSGTSIAAPLWAGYMALVNQLGQANAQGTVGFANYLLYQIGLSAKYNNDFHDINDLSTNQTIPKNPQNPGPLNAYSAVNGFDLATGWGTPTAALINDLSNSPHRLVTVCGTIEVDNTGRAQGKQPFSMQFPLTIAKPSNGVSWTNQTQGGCAPLLNPWTDVSGSLETSLTLNSDGSVSAVLFTDLEGFDKGPFCISAAGSQSISNGHTSLNLPPGQAKPFDLHLQNSNNDVWADYHFNLFNDREGSLTPVTCPR